MVLTALLEWLGVSGSLVAVLSAVLLLWHGRRVLAVFSGLATVLKIAAIFGLLGVLSWAGLIPGVDLQVEFAELVELVAPVGELAWNSLADVVGGLLGGGGG